MFEVAPTGSFFFGRFKEVRVYDGPQLVRGFDNLNATGVHTSSADAANTFILPETGHEVNVGIGVSARFEATPAVAGQPSPPVRVFVSAAGGDFGDPFVM